MHACGFPASGFSSKTPLATRGTFFLSHLLDGDPASNTLSWRWTAGLQTVGKHYIARAENIEKFTQGKFNPIGQLNETPEAIIENFDNPKPVWHKSQTVEKPAHTVTLIVTEEDVNPSEYPDWNFDSLISLQNIPAHKILQISEKVLKHRKECLLEACELIREQKDISAHIQCNSLNELENALKATNNHAFSSGNLLSAYIRHCPKQ